MERRGEILSGAFGEAPPSQSGNEGSLTRHRRFLAFGGSLGLLLLVGLAPPPVRQPQALPALAEAHLMKTTNILLVGTDSPKPGRTETRSDVLLLAACDPGRNRVSLLSIPRDTLVEIPGHGTDRINASHVYGGINLTRLMVEKLTGLRVDRFVAVDFRAFQELVDLLGGIEVEVDKHLFYQDKSQNLLIDLPKGRRHLNGREALGFVRYRRDPLGDINRVGRQQRLIQAVLDKARKENLWAKFLPLYRLARRYVRTDLNLLDLYGLRNFLKDLADQANVAAFTVPGWFSGPCWAVDREGLKALIEREFSPIFAARPAARVRDPFPVKIANPAF